MASSCKSEEDGLKKGGCSSAKCSMTKTIEAYREAALSRLRALEITRGTPEIRLAISILESPGEVLADSRPEGGETLTDPLAGLALAAVRFRSRGLVDLEAAKLLAILEMTEGRA